MLQSWRCTPGLAKVFFFLLSADGSAVFSAVATFTCGSDGDADGGADGPEFSCPVRFPMSESAAASGTCRGTWRALDEPLAGLLPAVGCLAGLTGLSMAACAELHVRSESAVALEA